MSNFMLRSLTTFTLFAFFVLNAFLSRAGFFSSDFSFYFFFVISATVLLLAAWEWSRLVGCHRWYQQLGYVLLSVVCFGILFFALMFLFLGSEFFLLPILALFFSILATVFVFYYARKNTVASFPVFYGIVGLFILPLNLEGAVFGVYPYPYVVLSASFLVVWIENIIGSFVGKRWGKHKLAPAIDPEKTIEGALAALVLVIVSVSVVVLRYHLSLKDSLYFIFSGCVLFLASIVGDLFVSLMKQARGVKVTSQLLLGYGGILDALSSLIFVAPIGVFFQYSYVMFIL